MARSPLPDDAVARPLPDPSAVERPWLSSYPPGVPPTYRYPRVPLWRFLDDAARDFPTVPATWFAGATLDHEQLRTQVTRLAAGLAGLGVGPGDRVALSCRDLPAIAVTFFAVLRRGAVLELLPEDHAPSETPRVVVADRRAMPRFEDAGDEVERVLVAGRDWLPPARRAVATARGWFRDRTRSGIAFRDLLETGAGVPGTAVEPDSPAVVVHADEGPVTHTHASLVAAAFQARLWIPDLQAGKERILLAAPLTEPFALVCGLLAGTLSAATLVLPASLDPSDVVDAAARTRPGLCVARPAFVDAVASDAGGLASLRVTLVDGPVGSETRRRFEVLGATRLRPVHAPAQAGIALAAPVYGRGGPDGALLPVTDTVALVVDDAGEPAADGEPGRLALHGPQLSPELADERGWLVTSSTAVLDDRGRVSLTGGPAAISAGGAA
ncbi:MAG: AMP-binding protein [Actinobacteria bacterium]|nr:AMP-binding protein [Actinomycetota bacterium]